MILKHAAKRLLGVLALLLLAGSLSGCYYGPGWGGYGPGWGGGGYGHGGPGWAGPHGGYGGGRGGWR